MAVVQICGPLVLAGTMETQSPDVICRSGTQVTSSEPCQGTEVLVAGLGLELGALTQPPTPHVCFRGI